MEGLKTSSTTSPTNRFLGQLTQPEVVSDPLEFDESDIVWSDYPDTPTTQKAETRFASKKSGLSASISDYNPLLIRRKPALDPTRSATSAARTIRPVLQPSPNSDSLSGTGHRKIPLSAPVNVPVWPQWMKSRSEKRFGETEEEDEEEEKEMSDEKMVPPHEMVARSQNTTFSVFEGVGRTLKGRDLRRVRNAVFQKTGFLE